MSTLNETAILPIAETLFSTESRMAGEDAPLYARCRRAVLRLSGNLLQAAEQRSDFAPFLLEAMDTAMTNLLEHGDERDLLLLEQWLDEESGER